MVSNASATQMHTHLYKKAHSLCRKAFYDTSHKIFVVVNDFLSFVTVISIITIMLESVSSLSAYHPTFLFLEYTTVIIFSLEYIGRIIGAPKKFSYVFSFFGLVDLISILPTGLHIANLTPLKSLRALRILRFLRMLRLAKVGRLEDLEKYSSSDASTITRLNVKIYLFTFLFSIIILGNFAYIFEHTHPGFSNIPLSMLWTLEAVLGGSISNIVPGTYPGIIVFMIARFMGFVLLGFLIHIISAGINTFLLGVKKANNIEDINGNF